MTGQFGIVIGLEYIFTEFCWYDYLASKIVTTCKHTFTILRRQRHSYSPVKCFATYKHLCCVFYAFWNIYCLTKTLTVFNITVQSLTISGIATGWLKIEKSSNKPLQSVTVSSNTTGRLKVSRSMAYLDTKSIRPFLFLNKDRDRPRNKWKFPALELNHKVLVA